MLFGEFNHTIDAKNRMFIPAKYREELGTTFVISKNLRDKCIKVMSAEEWEKYVAPFEAMPRKASEDILRRINSSAAQVSPDAQGRIILPVQLIAHADIIKNAVVVGCGKYAEIWAEEAYTSRTENEDDEALLKVLDEFGL